MTLRIVPTRWVCEQGHVLHQYHPDDTGVCRLLCPFCDADLVADLQDEADPDDEDHPATTGEDR